MTEVADAAELVVVRLVALPVDLQVRAAAHMNALNREFELIRRTAPDAQSAPHRLQALIERLEADFGGVGDEPNAELQLAIERGDDTIDLTYQVSPTVAGAVQELGDMLDDVDDYCRRGNHLLSLVTPDESLRYRRWFLGEFLRQVQGLPPSPWPSQFPWVRSVPIAADPDVTDSPAPLPDDWSLGVDDLVTTVRVSGPLDLESGPSLRSLALDSLQPGRDLVIDLRGSPFVDSVGLSVLIAIHLRAEDDGRSVRFVLGPAASTVVTAAGLDGVLRVDH